MFWLKLLGATRCNPSSCLPPPLRKIYVVHRKIQRAIKKNIGLFGWGTYMSERLIVSELKNGSPILDNYHPCFFFWASRDTDRGGVNISHTLSPEYLMIVNIQTPKNWLTFFWWWMDRPSLNFSHLGGFELPRKGTIRVKDGKALIERHLLRIWEPIP